MLQGYYMAAHKERCGIGVILTKKITALGWFAKDGWCKLILVYCGFSLPQYLQTVTLLVVSLRGS